MFAHFFFLILSLGILTFGAEVLVRGAASLALRLGLSSFFVGITIVGFGTSTPELATSVNAGMDGMADIALGNIVGSNIFNIALILGVTAVIAPIAINMRTVRDQLLIMIVAAFAPFLAFLTGGVLTQPMGVLFVLALAAALAYSYWGDRGDAAGEEAVRIEPGSVWARPWFCGAAAALGIGLLIWGSDMLVQSSVAIAREWGVSELAIGLTIVSAGTSAPELFTSVVAALRKQQSISLGNIVGSNIFNMLGIGGITSMPRQVQDGGVEVADVHGSLSDRRCRRNRRCRRRCRVDAAAGHPHGEAARVVVAAVVVG
jgi:cation:H+ antiporter